MGVISITITASATQTIPGIPNSVSISTSTPSTVFFSLDGSVPDISSPIYITPIKLPQTLLTVVLNVFATNGIDQSAIITQTYFTTPDQLPTPLNGDRTAHSATAPINIGANNDLYPFGTQNPLPTTHYTGTQNAGTTIYNPALPATPSGFDASEQPAGFQNNPAKSQFKQIYSTTNVEGEVKPGVGNLPAKTTVIGKQYPVEYTQEISSTADKLFNPRAMVVFQDADNEDPTNPVMINRPDFNLQNLEIVRDGVLLMNNQLDVGTTSGSFVRREYNARTNKMTCYYYDNSVGRWIISSYDYAPTKQNLGALYQMPLPRQKPGAQYVYPWVLWMRRRLI
jgi:hypothetical protein